MRPDNDMNNAPISPLMAELEGADTKSIKITEPEKPPVQSADPLDVKPEPAKAPRDAKGYRVAVRGEYFAFAPGGGREKVKKPFNAAFNLPSLDGALGVIRGRLLDKYLNKKYTDFVSARTCCIVSATPLSDATPESTNLRYMPAERLLRYIEDHKVPIDPALYGEDEAGLRASVIDFVQNPKGFPEREARRVDSMKADRALAELNPDIA